MDLSILHSPLKHKQRIRKAIATLVLNITSIATSLASAGVKFELNESVWLSKLISIAKPLTCSPRMSFPGAVLSP
jgi:hypothetical protein